MNCPLCISSDTDAFLQTCQKEHGVKTDKFYWLCKNCDLIYLDSQCYLSQEQEKARYATHNNSDSDEKYKKFLNQILEPLRTRVDMGCTGLDYGCGPSVVLSRWISDMGRSCENYDPLFYPGEKKLEKQYDFVVSTEVIEHFDQTWHEFKKLNFLVKPPLEPMLVEPIINKNFLISG